MSSHIRDGRPTEPELGSHETVRDGESVHRPDRDEGMAMALAEAERSRIRILVDRAMFCYHAGQTRRWHSIGHVIREETVAAHTWNVLAWLILLHPAPSMNLIKAAIFHDAAEHITGDMPRWVKKKVPGLDQLEAEILDNKGLLFKLNEDEHRWMAAVDLFDAWMFLRQNILAGNRLIVDSFQKASAAINIMDLPVPLRELYDALKWETVP